MPEHVDVDSFVAKSKSNKYVVPDDDGAAGLHMCTWMKDNGEYPNIAGKISWKKGNLMKTVMADSDIYHECRALDFPDGSRTPVIPISGCILETKVPVENNNDPYMKTSIRVGIPNGAYGEIIRSAGLSSKEDAVNDGTYTWISAKIYPEGTTDERNTKVFRMFEIKDDCVTCETVRNVVGSIIEYANADRSIKGVAFLELRNSTRVARGSDAPGAAPVNPNSNEISITSGSNVYDVGSNVVGNPRSTGAPRSRKATASEKNMVTSKLTLSATLVSFNAYGSSRVRAPPKVSRIVGGFVGIDDNVTDVQNMMKNLLGEDLSNREPLPKSHKSGGTPRHERRGLKATSRRTSGGSGKFDAHGTRLSGGFGSINKESEHGFPEVEDEIEIDNQGYPGDDNFDN